jgi:predicted metalloprotease with PDZ domain
MAKTSEQDGPSFARDTPATAATAAVAASYRVRLADPHAHLFEVTLTVAQPDPDGQTFSLPAWIPGSYMIREFARHVIALEARAGRRRIAIDKSDKHTWQAARCRGPLTLRYRVYAWDLSVRGAHFDATHAFFNGTSLFLRVHGQDHLPCAVELEAPEHEPMRGWRVATTLPRQGAALFGFGRYGARDYDELIDHPVEIGTFTLGTFKAGDIRHDVVITGRHDADVGRLCRDLAPVCEAQIRLFEPTSAAAPFDRFLFLVMAVGDGYGGLEHRASTALLCARNDLPHAGLKAVGDGYRRFLGLASHEYFHAWNVKRIKPAAFVPYALDRETYTRLLWIFEGFTSYYDDLMLARAGVIGVDDYLKALADTISGVLRTPGRHLQSVAESSFEAWTKYYRQDEQSPNSIVSYYTKGALVALALDLSLRRRSDGKRSLDDVMRALWRRYGRDFDLRPAGLREDDFPDLVREATGLDLAPEIRRWAYGTEDPPLAELLGGFGVKLALRPAEACPTLGIKTSVRAGDLQVATVYQGGPAHAAGLSAGDTLIALDDLRIDERTLKQLIGRRRAGQTVRLHAFRRDELMCFDVRLGPREATEASLSLVERPTAAALQLGRKWLGMSGKWPQKKR